jgi:hypothetical protein
LHVQNELMWTVYFSMPLAMQLSLCGIMFGALVFLYRVELHMQFSSGGTTVVYQSQQKLYIGLLSYETSNCTWLTIGRDWGRCYCIDNNKNKYRLVPWWTFYSLNLASGQQKLGMERQREHACTSTGYGHVTAINIPGAVRLPHSEP